MALISTEFIRTLTGGLGIDLVGCTHAGPLEEEARRFETWLNTGGSAAMQWLSRDAAARFNPRSLLEDAQGVIVVGVSYHHAPASSLLAHYAWGKDYHQVLTAKLQALEQALRQTDPGLQARICVDSSAIAEKPLAMRAGLGWQGRHGLIINPVYGSWLVLGILLINREVEPSAPAQDRCGTCRACIDACPTGALREDRTLDARRCLAYLSIEEKSLDIHPPVQPETIFGCDICQHACPWNQKAAFSREPEFITPNDLASLTLDELRDLSEQEYYTRRKATPLSRLSYARFRRNVEWCAGKSKE